MIGRNVEQYLILISTYNYNMGQCTTIHFTKLSLNIHNKTNMFLMSPTIVAQNLYSKLFLVIGMKS